MRERVREGLVRARGASHKLGNTFSAVRNGTVAPGLTRLIRERLLPLKDRIPGLGFVPRQFAGGEAKATSMGRVSGLRRSLEDTSQSLAECISSKEPAFLDIGNKLRDFSSRSRELSKGAESLTQTVSGDAMRQALRELEGSQQELRELWNEEEELGHGLRTALQNLTAEARSLQGDMGEFGPKIRQLHMLSLYTRIESARMGDQGSGFLNLAGQVEDLAQTTEEHIRDIGQRTDQTLENVQGASTRMKSTGSERTEGMLQGVEEACAEFGSVQERAREMSGRLDERTSAIASGVQEVVSSIQFHDITRQQVEHVTQVLSEVAAMLEEGSTGREEVLGWLVDVCSLQERQLDAARDEFTRAMTSIRENLGSIAERIRSLETDISSLASESGGEGNSALQRIRERVDGLMEPMRKALAVWNEVKSDMDTTASEVQGMESCVDQVEAISGEIKLIALNASIQAAHTGEQGRSMGVMAEAVRTLSSEVGDLTQRVEDRLKRIVQHSDSLRSEAERASELSRRQERLIGGLEEQVQSLQAKDEEVVSGLDWLHGESADLASAIEAADSGAHLEREVEAELTSAQEALSAVREASRERTPDAGADATSRSQRLQEILQRYTMESERMVHMAYAGMGQEQEESSEDGEQTGDVELFQDEGEGEGEDELGDNVELF